MAAANGHSNVVSLLLSKGTYQLSAKDVNGRTAFLVCAASGHLNVLTLMLAQGAAINEEDQVHYLLQENDFYKLYI